MNSPKWNGTQIAYLFIFFFANVMKSLPMNDSSEMYFDNLNAHRCVCDWVWQHNESHLINILSDNIQTKLFILPGARLLIGRHNCCPLNWLTSRICWLRSFCALLTCWLVVELSSAKLLGTTSIRSLPTAESRAISVK